MKDYKRSEFLTYISFTCIIIFFVILILFHVFREDHDPFTQTMSEYTIGPFGYFLPIALLLLGLSSYLSSIDIRKTLPLTCYTKNSLRAFRCWTIFIIIAGLFPTDITTVSVSISSMIHGVSSYFAFVSLPISHFYLSLFYKKDNNDIKKFYRYQCYFLICLLGFIFYLISPYQYKGIAQRFFLGFMILTYFDLISIPLRKPKY